MSMRTDFRTDTNSFANSFLMLVMVAGVLNIDLFESDVVSGYSDRGVLYRIELVFNAESPSQSPVLSISEDMPCDGVGGDHIHSSHFNATCFGTHLFVAQNVGRVNARPFNSPHNHTRSFNIPHQNSDEDDAFFLPVDVA